MGYRQFVQQIKMMGLFPEFQLKMQEVSGISILKSQFQFCCTYYYFILIINGTNNQEEY